MTAHISGPDAPERTRDHLATLQACLDPANDHTCRPGCICDAEEPAEQEPVSGWSADRMAGRHYYQGP